MLMNLMYIDWWRGPALDSPLSQVRASPGLTTQVMEPSPLTKCLDILQYEASLPTGILSIYLCIALSDKKNQISSKFLCWKERGKSN